MEEGAEGDLAVETLQLPGAHLVQSHILVGRQVVVDPPQLDSTAGKAVATWEMENIQLVDVVETEEEDGQLQGEPLSDGFDNNQRCEYEK